MKKYFMAAVALICMTMMCVSLTSCSSDDDDDAVVRYTAVTVGDNAFGDIVCNEMDAALASAFGSSIAYKRDDSKAIRICDEVAEKVRDNSLIGTIQLKVSFASANPNADNESKIIKTYQFPFLILSAALVPIQTAP